MAKYELFYVVYVDQSQWVLFAQMMLYAVRHDVICHIPSSSILNIWRRGELTALISLIAKFNWGRINSCQIRVLDTTAGGHRFDSCGRTNTQTPELRNEGSALALQSARLLHDSDAPIKCGSVFGRKRLECVPNTCITCVLGVTVRVQ